MDPTIEKQHKETTCQVKKKPTSKDDYEIIGNSIGRGAYGSVHLVKRDDTLYAMKVIQKKRLAKQKKQYQAFIERELLKNIDHPGIIKLKTCFQESKYIYYILEYCHGGDLTTFIKSNEQKLTEELRIFYIAQIVVILEFLHNSGITHRDLKPENIMLSKEGHLKLIDFGTAEITKCTLINEKFKEDIAKQKKSSNNEELTGVGSDEDEEQMTPRKRKSTFVGTSYYLSPELLENNICEAPSDLWALGIIIYQLYYFQTPFQSGSEFQIFYDIKNEDPKFPKNQLISEDAIDLIRRLLVKNPDERLGSNTKEGLSLNDLKSHPYFKSINFENIFMQEVPKLKEEQAKEEQ